VSQSKTAKTQGRAFYLSIITMLGFLGVVGGGVIALIRVAGRPNSS